MKTFKDSEPSEKDFHHILSFVFVSLIFLNIFFIFSSYSFNPNQETYLAEQCFNKTFTQCQDIRSLYSQNTSFNFTDIDIISNETSLISNVNSSLNNNLAILKSDLSLNISSLNSKLDSLDFSKYNDSALINVKYLLLNSSLSSRLSLIESKLNKLTGNSSDITFTQMFQNALKIQQFRQQKEQIDSMFGSSKSVMSLDPKLYVNKTEFNQRLNSLNRQPSQPVDTSQYVNLSLFIIVNILFVVVLIFLYNEQRNLKLQLQNKSNETIIENLNDTPEKNETSKKEFKL